MSNENQNQSSGTAPATTTASPSGDNQGSTDPTNDVQSLRKQLEDYKGKATKAEGDLGKIREFYATYPELVDFARKYTAEPKAAEIVRNYLAGKGEPIANTSGNGAGEPDFSDLPEDQRKAVEHYLERKLEERYKPVINEIQQLKSANLTQKIEAWRSTLTKSKGYPIEFRDVENDIAVMIREGKAIEPEGAYRQLVADHLMKKQSEQDKLIKELKVKASMSRMTVPNTMHVRQKGEKRSLESAFEEALTELGVE